MATYKLRLGAKPLNLGGGHFLQPGQTVQLSENHGLPGLEPVLERPTPVKSLEGTRGGQFIDADPGEQTMELY